MTGRDHPYRQADGVPRRTVREFDQATVIRRVAEPILSSLGLVLVDVEMRGQGQHAFIRLVIERPFGPGEVDRGVTVDDCERAHVLIGHALDVEDPIAHSYMLEVSSPGLDRPIRTLQDYERFQGRLARFKLARPIAGQAVLIGRIQRFEGTQVWVETPASARQGRRTAGRRDAITSIALPLANIREARLEVEF